MSDMEMDMGHSATWSPAISSTGYPGNRNTIPEEMSMTHAVTYTSGDSPQKIVVRRTFIECVSEEKEGLRLAAQRHRSEPAVPSFAGFEANVDETASTDSSNDGKGIQSAEGRIRRRDSYDAEKSDSEDSVEVFDGGANYSVDGSPMHREASEVGPLPSDSSSKLVVKRTFLEVVDPQEGGTEREHRSMSMPAGGQVSEDPNAPSLTEQLLERMRSMQGRSGVKLADGTLSIGSRLSDGSTGKASGSPVGKMASSLSEKSDARTPNGRSPGVTKTNSEGVRFAPELETVEQSQSSRGCSDFGRVPSTGAESESALELDQCALDDVEPDPSLGPKTTVMLRNLPSNYNRPLLLALLDREGFFAKYDFVYLPIDFGSRSGFGYAFINLCDVDTAEMFRAHFQGFSGWEPPCSKVADVTWSGTHQGFEQHVNRYRNSPVMHETMPDECKPIILKDGVRAEFPPPTKILRPPRIRPSKNRGAKLHAEKNS